MASLRKAHVKKVKQEAEQKKLEEFKMPSFDSSSEDVDSFIKRYQNKSTLDHNFNNSPPEKTSSSQSASQILNSSSREVDHIMAKIEQNNRILQELEKSRATVGSPVSNYNLERLRAQVEDKARFQDDRDSFYGKSNLKPSYSSPAIDQLLVDPLWENQMYSQLSKSPSRPSIMKQSLERLMVKLEEDNKILAELDRKRAAITFTTSSASSSPTPYYHQHHQQTHHHHHRSRRTTPIPTPHMISSSPYAHTTQKQHIQQSEFLRLGPTGEILGIDSIDTIDLPGRGRVRVYLACYTYDPFKHSPNENPEAELHLNSGDYILIHGDMDEDGFYVGELLDGRKGLVPSNFIQKLTGEDLFDFQASFLYGGGRDGDEYNACSTPDILYTGMSSEIRHLTQDDFHRMNDYIIITDVDDLEEEDLEELERDPESRIAANQYKKKVPPPQRLILERQLNKSILIGWLPSQSPSISIQHYDVYVDGVCRAKVKASERQRALIEGVDSSQPHRVSVRSVASNGLHSKDAACTVVIGKGLPLAPSYVKAFNVTSTSAIISWLPSNSNFQHIVAVNSVEVKVVKPGVFKYTITGLAPNTIYRVSVRPKPSRLFYSEDKHPQKKLELLTANVEFRTLPKGLPDPPVDIQLEPGPQDGTILVTWLPVTINPIGTSNGAPVTGYAVFAGNKKVGEINSPTGDHALLNLDSLLNLRKPCILTVRTKSGDHHSADSLSCPVPEELLKARQIIPELNLDLGQKLKDTTNVFNQMKDFFTQKGPPPPPQQMMRNTPLNTNSKAQPIPPQQQQQLLQQQQQQPTRRQDIYGRSNRSMMDHNEDSYGIQQQQHYSSRAPSNPRTRQLRGSHRTGKHHHDNRVRWFVALFDYDPYSMSPNPDTADEELAFQEGQLVKVMGDKDHDGFYQGELNGQIGFVPSNMVSEVQVEEDGIVRRLNPGSRMDKPMNPGVKRMIALYDYDPQELSPNVDSEMELTFKTGDIIFIHGEMDEDGFFMGELNGLRGLVPSNFLSEAPQDYQTGRTAGHQLAPVSNRNMNNEAMRQGYHQPGYPQPHMNMAPPRQPFNQPPPQPPVGETKLGAGLSALKNIFTGVANPTPQPPPNPQMNVQQAHPMQPQHPQQHFQQPSQQQQMQPQQMMQPHPQQPMQPPHPQQQMMQHPQQQMMQHPQQQHPQQQMMQHPQQQHPQQMMQHPQQQHPQQYQQQQPLQQPPPPQESKVGGLLSSVSGMFKGTLLKS